MKTKHLFLAAGLFVMVAFAHAQQNSVKVNVTLDHENWVYSTGETAKFKITVLQDGKALDHVAVQYEIGPEKMKPVQSKTITVQGKSIEIEGGTMKEPGFLRCKVKLDYQGKKYENEATAAFSPEKIEPTTTLPADFMAFWQKGIAENATVPMDTKMELWKERSNDKVNAYKVSFQNCKIGMRVYGILCIPKAPGKYPAVLQVPGAGVRPYSGDVKLAEQGIITFQIGIHGIPVTLDSVVYANLRFGALDNYPSFNMDNKDNYYYKHVYLGCVRANDLICLLPEYDGKTLAVSGGSQGGALSIVTAALDSRVKVMSCFYPALCDLNGYKFNRAGGWPHLLSKPEFNSPEKVETSRYYDVVNFARYINIPGFYSFGYNDETCPPTSMYTAFNSIKAPKTFFIVKEAGHAGLPEQYKKQWDYLVQNLTNAR